MDNLLETKKKIKKNNINLYMANKIAHTSLKKIIEDITHALVKIEEKINNFLILDWKITPTIQNPNLKIIIKSHNPK